MTDSSANNKRIAKNTLFLYLRMFITMLVSLYTSRIVLAALGVNDFGIYNVVGSVVASISFISGTLNTATSRYITVTLSKGIYQKSNEIFSSILLVNVLIGVLMVVVCESIGLWFLYEKMNIPEERMNAAFWVFQFSIATFFFTIVSVPYNATIIAHEKMKAFAYIALVDVFMKCGFALLLIYTEVFDRLILYAFYLFLIQIFNQIISMVYCIKNFNETKYHFHFEKKLFKEMYGFILWSAYGSLVSVGFTQGLNILLNLFFGPVVNAARGIAVQVQNTVNSFTINFQTAINPQLFKTYARQESEKTQKLLIFSSRFSFYLLCLFGLPIIGNTEYILDLWLKEVPNHTVTFVQLMLIICMFQSIANPLRIVNQAEGNIKKFQLYECTYLLLIVPIAYIVLKMGCSAEIVFLIQLFIEATAQFIRLYIVLPKISMSVLTYIKKVYLKIIPILLVLLVLISYLPTSEQTFLEMGINTLIIEILLLVLIYLWGLSKNEKEFIIRNIKNKLTDK